MSYTHYNVTFYLKVGCIKSSVKKCLNNKREGKRIKTCDRPKGRKAHPQEQSHK